MQSCPPVVFLIFNRPDLTERVFAEIRRARPTSLLVVADGPRGDRPTDIQKCADARSIVETVDWPCEVLTDYSNVNLGCRRRIATGIDWAFEHVQEAIVLEDDCLPHPSFFRYCAELLHNYRDDTRVMSISGDNWQQGQARGSWSYYFSKYATCWGWATWRRAWKHFDVSMSLWPIVRDSGALRHVCPDLVEHDYWHHIFEETHGGRMDSWAYAWVFAGFVQNGLSTHPNKNLISNIGFRADGTHLLAPSPLASLPVFDIGEIRHPTFMVPNRDADATEFDFNHGGTEIRRSRSLHARIRRFPGSVKGKTLNAIKMRIQQIIKVSAFCGVA